MSCQSCHVDVMWSLCNLTSQLQCMTLFWNVHSTNLMMDQRLLISWTNWYVWNYYSNYQHRHSCLFKSFLIIRTLARLVWWGFRRRLPKGVCQQCDTCEWGVHVIWLISYMRWYTCINTTWNQQCRMKVQCSSVLFPKIYRDHNSESLCRDGMKTRWRPQLMY